MLRAFLIVWTIVAGVAAAGLLYIVGWRPQTTVVAERLIAPSSGAVTGAPAASPAGSSTPAPAGTAASVRASTPAPNQGNTASAAPPAPSTSAVPNNTSGDLPTATGSIAAASSRSPTRTVRRIDEPRVLTAGSPVPDTVGKPTREARPVAPDRIQNPSEAAAAPAEPPKPLQTGLAANTQRTLKAESRTKPLSEPSAGNAGIGGEQPPSSPAAVTTAAPMSPPLFSERPNGSTQRTAGTAPAAEAPGAVPERTSNRALKQREKAKTETARTERGAETRTTTAERPRLKTAQTVRNLRRQARMAQRTRVARSGGRSGGLEQLLDEFSRSGADFLHERTIRVGTRYLVERTTRNGTQYYYEQR
jgi:hypothetical protein